MRNVAQILLDPNRDLSGGEIFMRELYAAILTERPCVAMLHHAAWRAGFRVNGWQYPQRPVGG
jgi:hypothetical protein